MVRGDRVDGIEYARRVNAAADLLALDALAEAAVELGLRARLGALPALAGVGADGGLEVGDAGEGGALPARKLSDELE